MMMDGISGTVFGGFLWDLLKLCQNRPLYTTWRYITHPMMKFGRSYVNTVSSIDPSGQAFDLIRYLSDFTPHSIFPFDVLEEYSLSNV